MLSLAWDLRSSDGLLGVVLLDRSNAAHKANLESGRLRMQMMKSRVRDFMGIVLRYRSQAANQLCRTPC